MATDTASRRRAVIGNEKSFWLYDSETGFDLTHPETPQWPSVSPSLTIKTTTSPITVDPAKSALVIIDMQNYFLRYDQHKRPAVGQGIADRRHHPSAQHSVDPEDPATTPATSSSSTPSPLHAERVFASSG